MPDYKRMYAVLCRAVDDAITSLESVPDAHSAVQSLTEAPLKAEEIYIDSSLYSAEKHSQNVFEFKSSK